MIYVNSGTLTTQTSSPISICSYVLLLPDGSEPTQCVSLPSRQWEACCTSMLPPAGAAIPALKHDIMQMSKPPVFRLLTYRCLLLPAASGSHCMMRAAATLACSMHTTDEGGIPAYTLGLHHLMDIMHHTTLVAVLQLLYNCHCQLLMRLSGTCACHAVFVSVSSDAPASAPPCQA